MGYTAPSTDTPQFTLISLTPDALKQMMEQAAEQGALRALQANQRDGMVNSGQAAQLFGYVRDDGTPNLDAFKMLRQKHPELAQLGRRVGRRWMWRRSDLEHWFAAHPQGGRASP